MSKMVDFTKSYRELKVQGQKVSENLAAIEEQVGIRKQRENELATERARYLDEQEALKDKLQASDGARLKAQYAEGVRVWLCKTRLWRRWLSRSKYWQLQASGPQVKAP